jgi:hypothetical protein
VSLLSRRVSARTVGGVVAVAIVGVLGVLALSRVEDAVVDVQPADTATDAASPQAGAVVMFPDAPTGADATEPEAVGLRPVGVRIVELGLEAPVIGAPTLPACGSDTIHPERVRWFGPASGDEDALPAVEPGRNGTALLVAGMDPGSGDEAFVSLFTAQEGQIVEVARSNGTLLRWTVVRVVQVPAGTLFPEGLLEPVDEQRLVLLGCGGDAAGAEDVYVLARRSG